MRRYTARILILLLCTSSGFAASYHIDFADGDDKANGRTPATAWKHSPGDKQATGNPAAVDLQPGDVVRFKGGVQYRGEIQWSNVIGTAKQPIIIDGNSDGSYGEGRAILDGAEVISEWKRVSSPEQAAGNPEWRRILYADVDMDLTSNFSQDRFILHRDGGSNRQAPWQRLFLIDGEKRVLPIAQRPKPSDPFYPDLPKDFHHAQTKLGSSYPHRVYYPEGSRGNRSLPLMAITYGGNAPVIEPFHGGEVAVGLDRPTSISEIGFKLFRPKSFEPPEHIVFYADGEEIYVAKVDPGESGVQRFTLPEPVKAKTITFQLRHENTDRRWTKLQQLAAYTATGENILEQEITTYIEDPELLTQTDPTWCNDVFVGVHGGNNHVHFAKVRSFDPEAHRLYVPQFSATKYKTTRYAFFNSPRFIDLPGEWSLEPLKGGGTRIYLMPATEEGGQTSNIGYPTLQTALSIDGVSAHIEVRGFLMQRYAGGKGGVAVNGRNGG